MSISTTVLQTLFEDWHPQARLKNARTLQFFIDQGMIESVDGTDINAAADIGGATASWESITANSNNSVESELAPAKWVVGGTHRLKHQFSMNKIQAANAAQRGDANLQRYVEKHLQEAVTAIRRSLNTAIYSGDGTATYGGFNGFSQVLNNTLPYAGLSTTTYPGWAAQVFANGGTGRALSRALLQAAQRAVEDNETDYGAVFVPGSILTGYENLFATVTQHMSAPGADGSSRARPEVGFAQSYFNDRPIISDPAALAGTFLMIDTAETDLVFLDLPDPVNPDGIGSHSKVNMGFPAYLTEIVSINSDVRTWELKCYAQLRVKNRKAAIAVRDLT